MSYNQSTCSRQSSIYFIFHITFICLSIYFECFSLQNTKKNIHFILSKQKLEFTLKNAKNSIKLHINLITYIIHIWIYILIVQSLIFECFEIYFFFLLSYYFIRFNLCDTLSTSKILKFYFKFLCVSGFYRYTLKLDIT